MIINAGYWSVAHWFHAICCMEDFHVSLLLLWFQIQVSLCRLQVWLKEEKMEELELSPAQDHPEGKGNNVKNLWWYLPIEKCLRKAGEGIILSAHLPMPTKTASSSQWTVPFKQFILIQSQSQSMLGCSRSKCISWRRQRRVNYKATSLSAKIVLYFLFIALNSTYNSALKEMAKWIQLKLKRGALYAHLYINRNWKSYIVKSIWQHFLLK